MKIIIKTNQGNIRVSGTFLITSALATFLLLIAMIRALDYATSSVVMNGTVSNVVTVNVSSALQKGILFGSLTANTNDNMAQNDSTSTTQVNCTDYWIGTDPSATGSINLWHKAANMNRGGVTTDMIGIGNVTNHANKTANGVNVNMTEWRASTSTALTATWAKIGGASAVPCDSLATGTVCYTAYWLDVPSSIPGGTYNTTYNYCGNLTYTTVSCDG
jgi:hypothetical protein